jgi:hypothetical protein
MLDRFKTLAQGDKITPNEVDDITLVGLEIL